MWLIPPPRLKEAYEAGCAVPLLRRFPLDADPKEIYARLAANGPSALLESPPAYRKFLTSSTGKMHPETGSSHRYSYIAWDPLLTFEWKGTYGLTRARSGEKKRLGGSPLDALAKVMEPYRGMRWPGLDFFTGGAVVCLGYELARRFEKLPRPYGNDSTGEPEIMAAVYDRLVVIDHREKALIVSVSLLRKNGFTFEHALSRAKASVEAIHLKLNERSFAKSSGHFSVSALRAESDRNNFYRMVRAAKKYIRAGDMYQANLSRRFNFRFEGDAFILYRRLHDINPAPFSVFLDWGERKMIGASPERLIKLSGQTCETRPIAGTRPRGADEPADEAHRRSLLLNEKERAEHLMLVDLERNDLGRVCESGSVKVDEWMTIETYSHVHHIVSNVVGTLRADRNRFDLIRAVFPGGTITGCPKIRSMEIIHELEKRRRGWYTGSVGFLDFNGDMDLNIIIRTVSLDGRKGSFRTGAGIVADSDERREFEETLHKARALFEALGEEDKHAASETSDEHMALHASSRI